uniref:Uncharacterized protein n=1 Tax=Plectus sambesii TaxID=2011161 RepID=A0A914WNR4_9BILA
MRASSPGIKSRSKTLQHGERRGRERSVMQDDKKRPEATNGSAQVVQQDGGRVDTPNQLSPSTNYASSEPTNAVVVVVVVGRGGGERRSLRRRSSALNLLSHRVTALHRDTSSL